MRSPFKFLDAYTYHDRANFFGRDEETAELYQMVYQSSLIFIYGLSGTGKTSLVQCGLAGRFDGPDWFPFFLRRQDDFNQSLDQALQKVFPQDAEPISAIPSRVAYLYSYYLRPIYLIFDQFEELFILGTEQEQEKLGETLAQLTQFESACKVILIIREEFMGQLYRLEKHLPKLFDFRLRVEPMTYKKVSEVVTQSCANFNIHFSGAAEPCIQAIYDNIAAGKSGIQLPYLQVYLDQLYRQDYTRTYGDAAPTITNDWPKLQFSLAEINSFGNIEDVLGRFLEEQKWQLQARASQQFPDIQENTVSILLDSFVTPEGTKRPIAFTETEGKLVLDKNTMQWLDSIAPQPLSYLLKQLIGLRILRQNESSLELAHDTLALLIDQQRSENQRRINEVQTRLMIAHKEHQDTQEFLSRKQLNVLEEFWPLLQNRLNKDIQTYVQRSFQEAERREQAELLAEREKRRKATRAAIIAISLAALALAATVFASLQTQKIRRAKHELSEAFVNNQIQTARTFKAEGRYPEALAKLEEIRLLKLELDKPQRDTLQTLLRNWANVEQLMMQASEATQAQELRQAIMLYQSAQQLSFDERVADLIRQTEAKLEETYQALVKAGDLMLSARQYVRAKENYEKALRIKPNDALVMQKLKNMRPN